MKSEENTPYKIYTLPLGAFPEQSHGFIFKTEEQAAAFGEAVGISNIEPICQTTYKPAESFRVVIADGSESAMKAYKFLDENGKAGYFSLMDNAKRPSSQVQEVARVQGVIGYDSKTNIIHGR